MTMMMNDSTKQGRRRNPIWLSGATEEDGEEKVRDKEMHDKI